MLDNAFYVDGATGVTVTDLGANNGTPAATISLSSLTVPAGALIVVLTSEATSGSAGTLADGAGNTYSTATSGAMSGAAGFGTIFYVANCSALNSQLITYTKQTSGRAASMTAFYVTGIATSTPLDAAVTATSAVNSATPTVTSGTPSQAATFVIGACSYSNASARTLTNSGAFITPFTTITAAPTAQSGGGHINISGGRPVTFNPTLAAACDNISMVVGFKLANSPTGWWGLTQWSNHTAAAGEIIRPATTPVVGSERVFVCTTGGATGATEPTWTTTRGALNTSSSAVYQEATGVAALNGDLTNTPLWSNASIKNTAITLGQVIQRVSGASYQICTTAGTAGNGAEPSFSNTAGTTTADNTVTWTSLGAVGNFTIFAAPHARLANAFTSTWGAAGNSFFAHSTHAEVQNTAITLVSPGTAASPCFIYSVGTGAVPPTTVTAGASIATTGASNLTARAVGYYAGFTFKTGSFTSSASVLMPGAASCALNLDGCTFQLSNTSATSSIRWGATAVGIASFVKLNNCPVIFGAATQSINTGEGNVVWQNTASAITGTVPTTLFTGSAGGTSGGATHVIGVDLSGSNNTIVGDTGTPQTFILQDCKFGSGTVAATPAAPGGPKTFIIRSDSGNTNYNQGKVDYLGTQTVETTIIRTGGGSATGTGISWKVVPSANCKWAFPFECLPIRTVINSLTGANLTLTLRGIWSGGAVPTNRDCWMQVEYLGTSGFPLGVFNSGTVASNLATSSPQNADTTSVWGAGSTTAFFMQTVLSSPQPQLKGSLNITIFVGANSGTFYFDPLVSLT